MASHKKKLKVSIEEETDEELLSFEELPDAVMEQFREHRLSTQEPFEQYADKIKAKIHTNAETFRRRFLKGYHALLDELIHEKK